MIEARKLTVQEINYVIGHLPQSNFKLYNIISRMAMIDELKTLEIPPDSIPYLIDTMMETYNKDINVDGSLKLDYMLTP